MDIFSKTLYMIKAALFFGICFLSTNSYCQTCLAGTNTLSQTEIDNFSTTYPGCTNILGELRVENNVNNLLGLSQVTKFSDYLDIRFNEELINLNGLENVDSVGGIYLLNNDLLSDLSALSNVESVDFVISILDLDNLLVIEDFNNLTFVGCPINIKGNDNLTSVTGFSNVIEIDGWLDIAVNPSLTDLSGFQNLEIVQDNFFVDNNYALPDYSGFSSLKEVGQFMQLVGNPIKTTLNGFSALEKAHGGLVIREFPELTSISSLSSLDTVSILSLTDLPKLTSLNGLQGLKKTNTITIDQNDMLTNLDALTNLQTVAGSIKINDNMLLSDISGLVNVNPNLIATEYMPHDIIIFDNPNLSDCSIKSICEYISGNGMSFDLHDNGTGCNTIAEIEADCCKETLVIDWSPVIGGIYEASGDIILQSNIDPNTNITLNHGITGSVKISSNVIISNAASLLTTVGGCD